MRTSSKNLNPAPWEDFDKHLTEASVSAVPPEEEAAIEEALGLQLISIRLQKSLIANLKVIADFHQVGYQPLIRDLLNRFVRSEMQIVLHKLIEQKQAMLAQVKEEAESQTKLPAVDDFLSRESEAKLKVA
jgi:hypothetical protein